MRKTALALGFFDGVHIAHQKIIQSAVNFAKENNLSPIALTFDRSPLEILAPEKVSYITDSAKKADLIKKLGADTAFLTLSEKLLSMTPEEFVKDILVDRFHISHAVCGYNYRFGKNGDGNTDTLCNLGKIYGFTVEICKEVTLDGISVSSSNIRTFIREGNVKSANALLGYNFAIQGEVSEGKKLGKTLGFPTANVFFEKGRVLPLCGVYKTLAVIDNIKMPSVTNVGINPTVGGEKMRSETYIHGFSEDIYGKNITIEFLDFIREEKKFANLYELKTQIKKDIEGGLS